MLERHVFLIGMPGSGKSSLGKRAAKETGACFADMDDLITKAAGISIPEIFAAYGEAAFRRAETHMLCHLTRARPMIISTGGGTVVSPENRKIMRCWGTILWVNRPLEEILGDIRMETRPLLQAGGAEKLRELYAERLPIYQAAADYTLENDQEYLATMNELVKFLRNRLGA